MELKGKQKEYVENAKDEAKAEKVTDEGETPISDDKLDTVTGGATNAKYRKEKIGRI